MDNEQKTAIKITPELVQQVTEKVYQLLLKDARLSWERQRPIRKQQGHGRRRLS